MRNSLYLLPLRIIQKNIKKAIGLLPGRRWNLPDVIPTYPHVYRTQFLDDTILAQVWSWGIALLDRVTSSGWHG